MNIHSLFILNLGKKFYKRLPTLSQDKYFALIYNGLITDIGYKVIPKSVLCPLGNFSLQ